ncbi:MAG: hypothetical protein PVG99_06590 [Desulfobacteraceae bacterium]
MIFFKRGYLKIRIPPELAVAKNSRLTPLNTWEGTEHLPMF